MNKKIRYNGQDDKYEEGLFLSGTVPLFFSVCLTGFERTFSHRISASLRGFLEAPPVQRLLQNIQGLAANSFQKCHMFPVIF